MSPIITHEDELELAKMEKDLVGEIRKLAKIQKSLIESQKKYIENVGKSVIARKSLNRSMRDVLKQMQTLAREKKSNIKDEEVNYFQGIVRSNDEYIEASENYLEAHKDVIIKKEYFITKKLELADAIQEVAGKRSGVIKKALNVEKVKNKLIEGDKLNLLDQELNDVQRDFDRTRDVFLKKMDQFLEVRDELNSLWKYITISEFS
ncbi:MAG: hypothetical protein ACFFAS_08100 [Promethearchaeota archaeon]